jgi:hypothetical protein
MNPPVNETQLAKCKRLAHELVVACIRDGTRSPLAPRIDAPASDSTRVAAQLNAAIEELAKPRRQNSSSTAWLRRQCAQRVFAFKRAVAAFARDQASASDVDEAERSLMDATTALADHIAQAAAPAPAEPVVTRESAVTALHHLSRHNGPGRFNEAIAILATPPQAGEERGNG